jgi:hypothetical protein
MSSIILSLFLLLLPIDSSSNHIWKKVYDPERLEILEEKLWVVGTINSIEKSFDGDIHIRLELDTLFHKPENYLAYRNYIKQKGCLVVEIVCGHNTIFPICFDYKNNIDIPKKGDKVLVSGSFVFDKRHRWNEIHPVYSIELINN